MKTKFILLSLLIFALLILLCGRKDTLYDPKDREPARCYALLSDTVISTPSLADTSHLATCDTIHTNDTVAFIGIVTPADADLKSVKWDFGDRKGAQEAITVHCYSKGGVYTGIFTIEDKVGITLNDTVVVHVNTRPRVTSLVTPADRVKDVDPKDARGIRFQWTASDADTGDSLRTNLYISADSLFLQPSATDLRALSYDYVGSLKTLKKYYWRIVVADKYGWTDTSAIYSFTTKDPNASGGILQGYAFYQGWKNHRGIKIIVKAPEAMERTAVANDSGYFQITSIEPRTNYVIIAMDSVKNGQFVSDTTLDSITMGVLTIADTLVLKDPFKPVIADNQPQGTVNVRRPRISASFSDRASGILVSSAHITFNDSDATITATINGSGLQWTPPARLPDDTYRIAVIVEDSAGNAADTLKWTVTVDAMSLSIVTPDTTVRINDTVRIRSKVSDVYSKVEQYKWDFDGNGTWDDSASLPDTIMSRSHVYTHEAEYKTIVYIEDDSGMVKLDTVAITVGNLPPVISFIRADTTISIKDSIRFFGTVTDADGTIKEYAWDFEGDGTFEFTNDMDIQAGHRYNTAGIYKAVLRVTDDDGKLTMDTAVVLVVQDAPIIAYSSSDTIIDHGGSIRCSVYVSQQYGKMQVDIDTANDGYYKSLGSLDLSGGKSYTIPVGNASSWDSVKIRITDDDGNVVIRGFRLDIRPRPLTITSIDSTVNTITVHYSESQETDFVEYRICRNTTSGVDTSSELWAAVSAKGTVSHATPTPGYAWEPRYYRVYQKDDEGLWSAGSNEVYGNIVNSPPQAPVIVYPANDGDSIWSALRWNRSNDLNSHAVRYRVMINYNNAGYAEYATEIADTAIVLKGYDSLGFAFKVIAYDSGGDSSSSAERSAVIGNTVTDVDGNVYRAVKIGRQIWMAENLKTTRFNDGTDIPPVTDSIAWRNLTTPGYCWYGNDEANKSTYGALYNWYTVNTGKLAPAGWHVPTGVEWDTLAAFLGGSNIAGGKLKEAGLAHWTFPNAGATNETGFSALPSGHRRSDGNFFDENDHGYWWSVTEYDASNAYNRCLYYETSAIDGGATSKMEGFSVRLIRD